MNQETLWRVVNMEMCNRIRERLEADELTLGARATDPSPLLIEVYADLGFDFVWIDLEHTGPSTEDATALETLSRAADAGGIDLLVRIAGRDPDAIRKALDAGVRTVLVPRVETAAEVREVIRASRFTHDGAPGGRGAAASRASGWGNAPDDYHEREDRSVCIGVMIENEQAMSNLDAILSVPDLGFVFIGPSDLSVSLGHPFETAHPDVREAVETIRTATVAADIPLGGIRNGVEEAREAVAAGYRLLRIGDEVSATREVLGPRLDEVRTNE